jgi:hypothetical protein
MALSVLRYGFLPILSSMQDFAPFETCCHNLNNWCAIIYSSLERRLRARRKRYHHGMFAASTSLMAEMYWIVLTAEL